MVKKFSDILPFARSLQLKLAELFQDEGIVADRVRYTLAVDSAYYGDIAYCVAIKYDIKDRRAVEKWRLTSSVFFPYVPGYFYLREAPPVIKLLDKIRDDYDLILIDAHGRLHPRKAGLATIIGILAGKPTIGIAKSRLIGRIERREGKISKVTVKGEVLGFKVGEGKDAFFVSQGNMISEQEVLKFIRIRDYKYPEELAMVDKETKIKENA